MAPSSNPLRNRREDDYRIEEMRKELSALRKEFSDAMYGNGKAGFKLQIDRLESDMRLIKWLGGIIAIGLAGQFIAALSNLIIR